MTLVAKMENNIIDFPSTIIFIYPYITAALKHNLIKTLIEWILSNTIKKITNITSVIIKLVCKSKHLFIVKISRYQFHLYFYLHNHKQYKHTHHLLENNS